MKRKQWICWEGVKPVLITARKGGGITDNKEGIELRAKPSYSGAQPVKKSQTLKKLGSAI